MASTRSDPNNIAVPSVTERLNMIITNAESVRVCGEVPLRRYYLSALEIHRMAMSYLRDCNYEKSLILLVRFLTLIVREFPRHPQYDVVEVEERHRAHELIRPTLQKAEELKVILKRIFQEDHDRVVRLIGAHRVEQENMEKFREKLKKEISGDEDDGGSVIVDVCTVSQQNSPINVTDPTPGTSKMDPFPTNNDNVMVQSITELANSGATLESSIDLSDKSIAIASDVVDKFLKAAAANTENNIETCGILCGQAVRDKFVVNHIVLPKQHGTADSCYAEGETEVFHVQRSNGLLTFGWIHTHPHQTAFLSSVDLHTHHAYQSAMHLAIAIVVSPRYNQVGTFALTPNGMETIGSCRQGGFHLHPDGLGPLFVQAQHVVYTNTEKTVVLDLRSN